MLTLSLPGWLPSDLMLRLVVLTADSLTETEICPDTDGISATHCPAVDIPQICLPL